MKKVILTAGPTVEYIDPVRFISNNSSGKMGIAITNELLNRGYSVTLVLGPVSIEPPIHPRLTTINVISADEMYNAVIERFSNIDIGIFTAAVADYTPTFRSEIKIKKESEDDMVIHLSKTKDILKSCGEIKKENQTLVGFALETNNEEANAIKKLKSKNLDMIVLNSLANAGAGFGHNTNKITIFDKYNKSKEFGLKSKTEVALDIVDYIEKELK